MSQILIRIVSSDSLFFMPVVNIAKRVSTYLKGFTEAKKTFFSEVINIEVMMVITCN